MDIEIRDSSVARLSELMALPIAAIAIGHESCPHKVPAFEELSQAAQLVRDSGKRFVFVMPAAYESFQSAMLDHLRKLALEGSVDVIVNDFGTLFKMKDLGVARPSRITLGSGLCYSYGQQPWIDSALIGIPVANRSALLQHSLDDPAIVPLLRDGGVTDLQVGAFLGEVESLSRLKGAGFRTAMLLDVSPVAFARACPTARHYGVPPPTCRDRCDQSFDLHLTHRWRLFHNNHEPMSRKNRESVPALTVLGNATYTRAPVNEAWLQADSLILDARFYAESEIAERIETLVRSQGDHAGKVLAQREERSSI